MVGHADEAAGAAGAAGGDKPSRRAPFAFRGLLKSEGPDAGLVPKGANGWGDGHGGDGVSGDMIWNEEIAGALGYGETFRAGAAFQWWIPVVATLTCLGSFIAWAVLVARGRDATDRAMSILGVDFSWWLDAKAVIVTTAVIYPVFVAMAIAVSIWRAHLAKTLDIHRPDARWLSSCRRYQWLNAITYTLLWLMVVLLVVSVASHAVWGYTAQVLDLFASRAIVLVGPVWSAISKVADSSKALSDRFTSMLGSLPAIGHRRLAEAAPGAGAGAGTVGSLLAAAAGAGAGAHGRALQQSGNAFLDGLGQLAQGIASGLSAAVDAIPARLDIPANVTIPGLPTLLPNGSANPLVGAVTEVTNAIETQIFNATGCPIYCIDLRNETWWADSTSGCLCNLDRVEAALPYIRGAWHAVIPAVLALIFMYIGASWLLLHGAAQWARTRSEAKLMRRLPAGPRGSSGGGGGLAPVDDADMAAAAAGNGKPGYGTHTGGVPTV